MRQKGFVLFPVIIVLLLGVLGYFIYQNTQLQKDIANFLSPSTTPTVNPLQPSPITTPSNKTTPTSNPTQNGASLENIRYTLPQGWKAEIRDGGISISPASGGGNFFIKVYNYSESVGRRDYYCQLVDYCIGGTTFIEVNIGNIAGYKASVLDNSGGGHEYFGAKGNKFYIINSYNPPSPNEFEKSSQQVLNSLIF